MGLSLKKPSREKNAKKAAGRLGEGEKRIVADVPEHIHRQVRVKCLQRGVLVRDVSTGPGLTGWLRVNAGTESETTAFLEAVTDVVQLVISPSG